MRLDKHVSNMNLLGILVMVKPSEVSVDVLFQLELVLALAFIIMAYWFKEPELYAVSGGLAIFMGINNIEDTFMGLSLITLGLLMLWRFIEGK